MRPRILYTYWGRRGALTQFTLNLAATLHDDGRSEDYFSVSSTNECFEQFFAYESRLFPVVTFASDLGAILRLYRVHQIKKSLKQFILKNRIDAVVELMPHVWSQFIMSGVRETPAIYSTVVHDAVNHPGDPTAWVGSFAGRVLGIAEVVFTLSKSVEDSLRHDVGRNINIVPLFHPVMSPTFDGIRADFPSHSGPIRLLFLGRIYPYKGLPLFLDMIEILNNRGLNFDFSIMGDGPVGNAGNRIANFGGNLVNRWLSEQEIANALRSHDVVVLSHVEASQSGVAALAMGAGLPVAATPVGGLVEQVLDGENGFLATEISAESLADAVQKFFDPDQLMQIKLGVARTASTMSMQRFSQEVASALSPLVEKRRHDYDG
jgi:glycosyltransferase involved in cell wall biosynthesis